MIIRTTFIIINNIMLNIINNKIFGSNSRDNFPSQVFLECASRDITI